MLTSLALVSAFGAAGWWNATHGHERLLFRPKRPTYRFDPKLGFASFGPNQEYWLSRYHIAAPAPPPPPPQQPTETAASTPADSAHAAADMQPASAASRGDAAQTPAASSSSPSRRGPITDDGARRSRDEPVRDGTTDKTTDAADVATRPSAGGVAAASTAAAVAVAVEEVHAATTREMAPPPQHGPGDGGNPDPVGVGGVPVTEEAASEPAKLLVFFLHGTGGNIGSARLQLLELVESLRRRRRSACLDLVVAAAEYPGYGHRTFDEVQPTERTAKLAVWSTLQRVTARYPAHRLVLVGYSIGVGLATWLARACEPPPATPPSSSPTPLPAPASSSPPLPPPPSSSPLLQPVHATPGDPACVPTSSSPSPLADPPRGNARAATIGTRQPSPVDLARHVSPPRDADADPARRVPAVCLTENGVYTGPGLTLSPLCVSSPAASRPAVPCAPLLVRLGANQAVHVRQTRCVSDTYVPSGLRQIAVRTERLRLGRPRDVPAAAGESKEKGGREAVGRPVWRPRLSGLMLVSGFSSAESLLGDYGAGLLMPTHVFDNRENVRKLSPHVPLYIVHGAQDDLIHCSHSRALYLASRSTNKRYILQRRANHYNVRFLHHLRRFLRFFA